MNLQASNPVSPSLAERLDTLKSTTYKDHFDAYARLETRQSTALATSKLTKTKIDRNSALIDS